MPLSIGIVGLPNVGKSTLFNAITNSQAAAASNYPFCTIEPNTGIVAVPDARLEVIAKISQSEKITPAVITFVDIAGLVKGASKGEGLGNKFLANIRETSAIAQVVRCFDDPNIVHVSGKINPLEDIETIEVELVLADFEMAQKLVQTQERKAKGQDKTEIHKFEILKKIEAHLAQNLSMRTLNLTLEETKLLSGIFFLTQKPIIFVANIAETDIGKTNEYTEIVKKYAEKNKASFVIISAKIESELAELSGQEKIDFLKELGIKESGLDALAHASYKILGLQSYLTTGPKESRAWTIQKGAKAPEAAGVIHTDFEKGFIRANVLSYPDFVACKGWKIAKEKGLVRQEGKEYIMQNEDIVEFLFNV